MDTVTTAIASTRVSEMNFQIMGKLQVIVQTSMLIMSVEQKSPLKKN